MRLLLVVIFLFVVSACSTRQNLVTSETKQYWYCQPASSKSWDCGSEERPQDTTSERQPPVVTASEPQIVTQPTKMAPNETLIKENETVEVNPVKPIEVSRVSSALEKPITEPTPEKHQTLDVSMSKKGEWLVQLASFRSASKADDFIKNIGLGTRIEANIKQATWYQVVIDGFLDKKSAQQEVTRIRAIQPQLKPWIRKSF